MNDNEQPPDKSGNTFAGGCVGLLCGSGIGGVGALFLTPLYYHLTNPRTLEDAQFGMVYTLTLPLGIILGAFVGAIFGAKHWD